MAVDPEVKTPTESTNDPISSEGKEELVEDAQVDILEEDDDFEEFKEDQWDQMPLNADEQVEWEDNWDDEEHDDDFSKRLRAEITSTDKRTS